MHISGLSELMHLSLAECTGLTGEGFAKLSSLRELSLKHGSSAMDAGMQHIDGLAALELTHLKLADCARAHLLRCTHLTSPHALGPPPCYWTMAAELAPLAAITCTQPIQMHYTEVR